MALNLQSLSISSIFNSIVNFFRSQENNSRWKDLTVGSEGSFLIRLLSNVFSAISYRIVAQSRENYLSTAALTSSNTGIAVNLGYSVKRGTNLKRWVTIVPKSDFTIPKLAVIGSYNNECSILNAEDTDITLVAGEPKTFKTVVGRVKEESFVVGTEAIKFFSLFTTGISEDYVLFVDGNEVPTTDIIKQLKDDKYLVRTNPFGSVDIAYLNTSALATHKYGVNSEITIRYVELEDVEVLPYTNAMFSTIGTLQDYYTISGFIPFETVDNIKVTAPLDHEIQNLIRSKADYAGRLRQLVPTLIDWTWKALTPTYTLVSYLKNDSSLLLEDEEKDVLEVLKENRYFGTPLPDITVPRREVADLVIDIALRNKYTNISDIKLDVDNVIQNNYQKALGIKFSVYDLESKIEDLSYVKYARVNHRIREREPNKNYQLGYILENDGKYYKASKMLGQSGDSDPQWNLPDDDSIEFNTGLKTVDGDLTWVAYKRLPSMSKIDISQWERNTAYGIGDYVYDEGRADNYMFKCVDVARYSGQTLAVSDTLEEGDFVVDGGIVWVRVADNDRATIWQSTHRYKLGDLVSVTTTVGTYTLECVSYAGTVGARDVDFESNIYSILQTVATPSQSYFVLSGDKNSTKYFRPGDVIHAYSEPKGDLSYTVKSSTYENGHTRVLVVGEINTAALPFVELRRTNTGTIDGQIMWSPVADPNEIQYDWNSYITFSQEINIIGD